MRKDHQPLMDTSCAHLSKRGSALLATARVGLKSDLTALDSVKGGTNDGTRWSDSCKKTSNLDEVLKHGQKMLFDSKFNGEDLVNKADGLVRDLYYIIIT